MMTNYFHTHHQPVCSRIFSGVTGLYAHQKAALLAIYQKAMRREMDGFPRQAALILAGVGTGKTLIQALTPYLLGPWMRGSKVLFLSDNCTLRSRFLRDFPTDSQGHPLYSQWLLYRLKILTAEISPPKIVELDAGNFASYGYVMHEADILVGNRQFVVNLVNRGDIEPNSVGLLVVDEAHFTAAASYRTITQYFHQALLTYFTGSKFRSDSQPLPYVNYTEATETDERGNSQIRYAPIADYQFSLQDAWKLDPPPIKKLTLQEATSEAFLVEEDGVETSYSPEAFFAKAECDRLWFRKIVFSDRFSLPVLEKAVDILLAKREKTGQPHAMIIRALNIPHVHRVAQLLEANFPRLQDRIGAIHSDSESYDLAGRPSEILQRFYNGDLWVLVHCGMVGVGFDHLWASVSCCLCILKTLSPAEQEWGRIIRRVPGESPGQFPRLDHPNWGVVVTDESLNIRPLFEQFLQGVDSDIIREGQSLRPTPTLAEPYVAGETVLTLSNTASLQPGDVLQLRTWVEPESVVGPPVELNVALETTPIASENPPPPYREQTPLSPAIASKEENRREAIAQQIEQLRHQKGVSVRVEAVLDSQHLQITPAETDLPSGVKVTRSRTSLSLPDAHFLDRVNLDWQVMVGDEVMSDKDYRQRTLLESKGFTVDPEGEILLEGKPLRSTMPAAAYELFLKGLETELEGVDESFSGGEGDTQTIARPDKAKLEIQGRYGAQVRSLIHHLLSQRSLVPDGAGGTSLLNAGIPLLVEECDRAAGKENAIAFTTNQQLLHSAVFAHIKETTGRSWSEHDEQQYQDAYRIARIYLIRLQEQLKWRNVKRLGAREG